MTDTTNTTAPAAPSSPSPPLAARRRAPRYRGLIIGLAAVGALLAVLSTQVTLFVVQPIGALPKGRTLVISRLNNGQFIDSADAICERLMGGVSLMCRGIVLGRVTREATVYARLPYSSALYDMSTGGREYDR